MQKLCMGRNEATERLNVENMPHFVIPFRHKETSGIELDESVNLCAGYGSLKSTHSGSRIRCLVRMHKRGRRSEISLYPLYQTQGEA